MMIQGVTVMTTPSKTSAAEAETGTSDSVLLDEKQLASLERMVGRQRVAELLERMSGRIPAHLAAIDAALAVGNPEDLFGQAHGLKGAASMLGLVRLTAAAHRLCMAANDSQLAGMVSRDVRAAAEATLAGVADRLRHRGSGNSMQEAPRNARKSSPHPLAVR
ncbi:MAG: hypothetical protein GVY13_14090 [Alphaproteobacteria bacterium]|jgi:HPt (histidine-containing phosphotransfer) domain-containing protein|nr:hypothetical protein [Alphaproteobacteria bacterium]